MQTTNQNLKYYKKFYKSNKEHTKKNYFINSVYYSKDHNPIEFKDDDEVSIEEIKANSEEWVHPLIDKVVELINAKKEVFFRCGDFKEGYQQRGFQSVPFTFGLRYLKGFATSFMDSNHNDHLQANLESLEIASQEEYNNFVEKYSYLNTLIPASKFE